MTKRNEKTSPAVARDASAILNFKAEPFIDADTKLECARVPMTYIRRARRVAASCLTQAADRERPPGKSGRLTQKSLAAPETPVKGPKPSSGQMRPGNPVEKFSTLPDANLKSRSRR